MTLLRYQSLDKNFLEKQLNSIIDADKELAELERITSEDRKKYQDLVKKLPSELIDNVKMMQELIEIRDWRFEMVCRGCFAIQNLLRSLAEKMNISYEELVNMTPNEVRKRQIPENLSSRLQGFACVKQEIYVDKELKELWNLFNQPIKATSVTGMPANKGKITGRVKVLHDSSEVSKLEPGDIIVCDMTTPDYIAGIKKAGAIVTNIGGLTCHAAVVSREFGMPAVVGTGNATLVFKDGDYVEVDADKGVVKIIN
jgi:phosphoenolpyruvate synthase/pyruvate phosphate dikinase